MFTLFQSNRVWFLSSRNLGISGAEVHRIIEYKIFFVTEKPPALLPPFPFTISSSSRNFHSETDETFLYYTPSLPGGYTAVTLTGLTHMQHFTRTSWYSMCDIFDFGPTVKCLNMTAGDLVKVAGKSLSTTEI